MAIQPPAAAAVNAGKARTADAASAGVEAPAARTGAEASAARTGAEASAARTGAEAPAARAGAEAPAARAGAAARAARAGAAAPAVPVGPTPRGPVQRRTLVDVVGERLAEMLLAGDLEPGAPLRIDALARDWSVSPTPVREALAHAEASGLVVRVPMRGYQVAPELPSEDFAALMELRRLLEPHCAAVAAERADAATLDYLDEVHETMRSAPRGPTAHEYAAYLRADVAFHEALTEVAGNPFVRRALALGEPHVHRFRRFRSGAVDDADDAVAEHAAVLAAVRAGDPDGAAAAMRAHLAGVERRALDGTRRP